MAAYVSIVIPNYNGQHLMARHLPGVIDALAAYGPGNELIVVDDGSRDASVSWLKKHAPGVRVLVHRENRGFQAACTTGVDAASHEIVVLLNTDVDALPGFIAPLVDALAPDDVFAAGCLALDASGNTVSENLKIPYLESGTIKFGKLKEVSLDALRAMLTQACPTFFVTGGFMAMKRSVFFELGGFDPLFEPFYYEDADLCYRAWKRGYRVLLEPASAIIHKHEGSILEHHQARHVRRIQERNRLILLWKNLTSPTLFKTQHLRPLILKALTKWITLDFDFYWALREALKKKPQILSARADAEQSAKKTDEEIFTHLQESSPTDSRR